MNPHPDAALLALSALATRRLAEIAKITPLPVTQVIVTHYHVYNTYLLLEHEAR